MPIRTIDTRLARLIEHRRNLSARPGRPLPKGPVTPPEEDERADRPFDDWPFEFDALVGEHAGVSAAAQATGR